MKIALGLGCDRNTPVGTLRAVITAALGVSRQRMSDIVAVGSIDLKADEAALLQLVAEENWPIRFYTAAELATVDVPHPSETVRKYTGTPSVSEAAALLTACPGNPDASLLIIEKLCHRGQDGRNATVSIARIPE